MNKKIIIGASVVILAGWLAYYYFFRPVAIEKKQGEEITIKRV